MPSAIACSRPYCCSTWSTSLPTSAIALVAASLSPTFQVRMNFSTAPLALSSDARTCDMPASPAALVTNSLNVPPIRSTCTMAKPASRTRKLNTSAKPPKMRGRTPIEDNIEDTFMGLPGLTCRMTCGVSCRIYLQDLLGRPNRGDQLLAEPLLEFGIERLDRIDECLAIDLVDDLHARTSQFLQFRVVDLRLPGRFRTSLGGRHQGRLLGGRKLFEHLAIGYEGDRREEMPGHGQVFLDLLETAARDRRQRVFLTVEPSVLQRAIDQRKVHRHHLRTQRLERHHVGLVRDHADRATVDVGGVRDRPPEMGQWTKPLLANASSTSPLSANFAATC